MRKHAPGPGIQSVAARSAQIRHCEHQHLSAAHPEVVEAEGDGIGSRLIAQTSVRITIPFLAYRLIVTMRAAM